MARFNERLVKTADYNGQAFSSTDYSKTVGVKPGIVFPLQNAKWQPSISSIVDHKDGKVVLRHTESRLCNSTDKEINYYKGRTISYVRVPKITLNPSEAEKLFEIKPEVQGMSYYVTNEVDHIPAFVARICQAWEQLDYAPDTSMVLDENLTKKTYSFSYSSKDKDKDYLWGNDSLFYNDKEAKKPTTSEMIKELQLLMSDTTLYPTPFISYQLFFTKSVKDKQDYLNKLFKTLTSDGYSAYMIDEPLEEENMYEGMDNKELLDEYSKLIKETYEDYFGGSDGYMYSYSRY